MQGKKQDFVIFFIFIAISNSANADCDLPFTNSADEQKLPVPLYYDGQSNYEVAKLQGNKLHLKDGETFTLFCSGPKNSFKVNSQVSSTTCKCIQGQQIEILSKTHAFATIQCKKIVMGEVRKTNNACGNSQGKFFDIGYKVPSFNWIILITTCYKSDNGNTLYSGHTINGSALKFGSKSCYTPIFSKSEQIDIDADAAYTIKNQLKKFKEILGSETLANKYINAKSFLAEGHLSPRADFVLATQRYTTFFYINAAPQWQIFNTANWKRLENTVRGMSIPYEGFLKVYTGTYGILKYKDEHDNLKKMFLGSDRKLPVPKYFWKIVYRPRTQQGIVFIGLNDPFVSSPEVFCPNICKAQGYNDRAWDDTSKGYIFCCTYSAFQNIVKTGPSLTIIDILPYPFSGPAQIPSGLEDIC